MEATAVKLIATLLAFFAFIVAAVADQSSLFSPTTGTVTGLNLTNNYNSAINALNTCSSGTAAPVNQLSGVPSLGNCWLNTNTAPTSMEVYDGTQWVVRGYLDTVSHLWIPNDGSNLGTVASAATTNLCSSPVNTATAGASELISGTTTINSFGTNCPIGSVETVEFLGILTLTNSASLVLPTAANITTAAGDWATFIYAGSGNWINTAYLRATGAPLSATGISIGGASLANTALSYTESVNLGLTGTVASNNLTMCVVANDTGTAPTAGDPVIITLRNSTISNGQFTTLKATASTCFTINSGNTMGTTNSVPFRLWIVAINNGGTLLIGAYTATNGSSCIKLNEGALITSGAGTNGGSTAQTLQTSVSAAANVQIKTLGYMEWSTGLGTAGTWNASPTYIQLMGPNVKNPCDVVASYIASGTSTPLTKSITPTSAADFFEVQCQGTLSQTTAAQMSIVLQRNASPFGNGGSAWVGASATQTTVTPIMFDGPFTSAITSYGCAESNATSFTLTLTFNEMMG
jgi:hypothetical protein